MQKAQTPAVTHPILLMEAPFNMPAETRYSTDLFEIMTPLPKCVNRHMFARFLRVFAKCALANPSRSGSTYSWIFTR